HGPRHGEQRLHASLAPLVAACPTQSGPAVPQKSWLRDRAAHRSQGRRVPPWRGDHPHRMVSRDGRAGRDRRRARGDRKRRPRDRPVPRPILTRAAPAFYRRVRATHRTDGTPGTMKLLMPLRVPELAPSLGRIIVPRRLLDPWVPLDDIREELATRVLELGGEGRAASAREADGDARARVLEVTGRRAWT